MRISDWSSDVCSSDLYGVGGPLLLEKVDFSVEPGERIALIGRNGAGKSTLLRLLSGDIRADDGQLRLSDGVRIARLTQEVPPALAGTVYDVVAQGLGEQIGRASCRERVCQYVYISVVAVSLKKKPKQQETE